MGTYRTVTELDTSGEPGGQPDASPHCEPTYVVGLGASAGGLEALEQFFDAMPPESGMAFVVRLPLTGKRPPRDQVAENVDPPSHASILIVEDNPDARESLRSLLELDGHEVSEAQDGATALDVIEHAPPQVALIDIGLPDMSGYEVARRIRGNHALDSVLLVALTGFGQESDRAAALAAGFDAHMVKPLDLDELLQLLAARCCVTAD